MRPSSLEPLIPIISINVLVILGVYAVSFVVRLRRRGQRSPLSNELLRGPGESLRKRLEDVNQEIMYWLGALMLLPTFIYGGHISQSYFLGFPESLVRTLASLLVGVVFSGFALWKLKRFLTERNTLRAGLDGEMAVGEELNQLMLKGYRVFHDFPAQKFNIDHVVAGPAGVFAVETKGRGKPDRGEGKHDATVIFDGKKLLFPNWHEQKPIEQAVRQAKSLAKWLTSAIGEKVAVDPVLVLPGWYVERRSSGPPRVLSGKECYTLAELGKERILSDSKIQRIAHQLEQRCRDVAPAAYRKIESE